MGSFGPLHYMKEVTWVDTLHQCVRWTLWYICCPVITFYLPDRYRFQTFSITFFDGQSTRSRAVTDTIATLFYDTIMIMIMHTLWIHQQQTNHLDSVL